MVARMTKANTAVRAIRDMSSERPNRRRKTPRANLDEKMRKRRAEVSAWDRVESIHYENIFSLNRPARSVSAASRSAEGRVGISAS